LEEKMVRRDAPYKRANQDGGHSPPYEDEERMNYEMDNVLYDGSGFSGRVLESGEDDGDGGIGGK